MSESSEFGESMTRALLVGMRRGKPPRGLCSGCHSAWRGGLPMPCVNCGRTSQCETTCVCVAVRRDTGGVLR